MQGPNNNRLKVPKCKNKPLHHNLSLTSKFAKQALSMSQALRQLVFTMFQVLQGIPGADLLAHMTANDCSICN